MTDTITIEIDDREVRAALDRLVRAGVDLDVPLAAIGRALQSEVQLEFRGSHAPDGTPWEPLKHRQGKPLEDTGVLRDSIGFRVDGDAVEIGTNIEYAPTHQFGAERGQYGRTQRGSPIPWGDVPARPFFPVDTLPDDWRDEILDILGRHLERALSP